MLNFAIEASADPLDTLGRHVLENAELCPLALVKRRIKIAFAVQETQSDVMVGAIARAKMPPSPGAPTSLIVMCVIRTTEGLDACVGLVANWVTGRGLGKSWVMGLVKECQKLWSAHLDVRLRLSDYVDCEALRLMP